MFLFKRRSINFYFAFRIKKLTRTPDYIHSYEWSRDKSKVAFVDTFLHIYSRINNEVSKLNLKGSNPHWISENEIIFLDEKKQFVIANIEKWKAKKIFPIESQNNKLNSAFLKEFLISPDRMHIVFSDSLSNAEGGGRAFREINISTQELIEFYRYSCQERNYVASKCKDEIVSITNGTVQIYDGLHFYEYEF